MDRVEQERMDQIYKNTPLAQIPWNMETPPAPLIELVDSGKVQPCTVVDLGCGAGNYAIYLAERGFNVTGVDISPTAIKMAKENANSKGLKCDFFVADVVEGLGKLDKTWDFAYDWGLLHHILPEHREKYVQNVAGILRPGGNYLSVCFSEKDKGFGSPEKYRKTSLNTVLYFSGQTELRQLFEPYFQIMDLRTLEIAGKLGSHIFNYVFMERK